MSFYPIGSSIYYDQLQAPISEAEQKIGKVLLQNITGKYFPTLTENPELYQKVKQWGRAIDDREITCENFKTKKNALGHYDIALSEINEKFKRIKSIGLEGARGSADSEEFKTLANEVKNIKQSMLEIGNMQNENGDYIFSGHTSNIKPLETNEDGTIRFVGDNQQRTMLVGSKTEKVGFQAKDFFLKIFNTLDQLEQHLNMQSPATLATQDTPLIDSCLRDIRQYYGTNGQELKNLSQREQAEQRRIRNLKAEQSRATDIPLHEARTRFDQQKTQFDTAMRSTEAMLQLENDTNNSIFRIMSRR